MFLEPRVWEVRARPFLEQTQLFVERLHWPLGGKRRTLPPVGACQLVLLPQTMNQLREPLRICRWPKGAVLITVTIILDQVGKVLFEERKKDGRRTGLQKKWIGKNIICATRRCSSNQSLKICGGVGDSRNHRRAADSDPQSCLSQSSHRVEPQIGTRSTRLENPGQIR